MRLRSALVAVPAAAVALCAPAVVVQPQADAAEAGPRCAAPGDSRFPVSTGVRRGAGVFVAGGRQRGWEVELRNTTAGSCRGIHPVAVLSGADGSLGPAVIRLEFHDDEAGRWRRVAFHKTDRDENVGAFAGDFKGFTLPARGSRIVRIRMGFTEDAPAGAVTASVTAMQRRGGDGEWVGQSADYDFTVTAYADRAGEPGPADDGPGAGVGEPGEPAEPGGVREPGDVGEPGVGGGGGEAGAGGGGEAGVGGGGGEAGAGGGLTGGGDERDALADTGPAMTAGFAGTVGAFLLGGGALLAGARRHRR